LGLILFVDSVAAIAALFPINYRNGGRPLRKPLDPTRLSDRLETPHPWPLPVGLPIPFSHFSHVRRLTGSCSDWSSGTRSLAS
jgi:hypothetical protein